jgi:hypothetical protein
MSDPDTKLYKAVGKLGSATNIWSLGASIISICNRNSDPKTDFYSPKMAIPTFNENARHVYSEELRGLVDACVRYRGDDRIGAQDLLESISRFTAGTEAAPGDADLANGMRAAQSTSAEAASAWRSDIKERYRLGMSYNDGKAERVAEEKEDADKAAEEEARREQEAADAAQAERDEKAAAAKAKREAARAKREATKEKKGKK